MAARSKRHIAGIRQLGESFPDTGINLFETGIAPYPNYTNLTFQPTREDTRFYQAGRDGEVEIEAFRLKNEELYRKDPLYQLRLNLLAPETNAIKALSNKSTREMMEEIMKSKYKKLLEEKKYFENVPERFHPLIRRILEQNKISPKEGDAVAQELDNAVRMGQVSDVMARQIRRMIESQTEITRQFGEQEEQRTISDLAVAKRGIVELLRRDHRLDGKPSEYIESLADFGIKDALEGMNAADLTRGLNRLVRMGQSAAMGRHIINYQNIADVAEGVADRVDPMRGIEPAEVVEQDEDMMIGVPRTRNGAGEGADFPRRATLFPQRGIRGVADIWAESDDFTGGTLLPDGYRITPPPSSGAYAIMDDFTGLPTAPRLSAAGEAERINNSSRSMIEELRGQRGGNDYTDYIELVEDARDRQGMPRLEIEGRGMGGAMAPEERARLRRLPEIEINTPTAEELFRAQFIQEPERPELPFPERGRGRGRGGRGRGRRGRGT